MEAPQDLAMDPSHTELGIPIFYRERLAMKLGTTWESVLRLLGILLRVHPD